MEPRELPTNHCDNPVELEAACARIEALSVVNGRVLFLPKHNHGTGRIKVNVWCRSLHESFKEKQPYVDLKQPKDRRPYGCAELGGRRRIASERAYGRTYICITCTQTHEATFGLV